MIAFAFIDADGIPTSGGSRRTLPDGAVALPQPFTTADLPRLIWTGAEWQERPQLTIKETVKGVTIPEMPGCTVTVLDNGTGAEVVVPVAGVAATIASLPTNCDVTVIASSELPWRNAEARIVRGAGSAVVAAAQEQAATVKDLREQLAMALEGAKPEAVIAAILSALAPQTP